MNKKYYIYIIIIGLLLILSIIYLRYNNVNLSKNNNIINLKNEKQYFLDKKSKNINNTIIIKENNF